jgi:formiminotetrahydrofolate cyclodeaminase
VSSTRRSRRRRPPPPPTLSDAFDSINSNHRGPGGGVLGAVAAAPAGGDAPVAADAFENNDKWGASDRTVEDLRRQAATESASLIGTQFERA